VRFTVGGTDSAPDDASLPRTNVIFGRFAEVEGRAVEFLRGHEPEISAEKLPNDFTMEFRADKDDSRVGFVEFKSGQP
jgi:hypothetical protein